MPISSREVRSVFTERDKLLVQRHAAARTLTSGCSNAATISGKSFASIISFRQSSWSEQIAAKASKHD
jgi:hypothetical protein